MICDTKRELIKSRHEEKHLLSVFSPHTQTTKQTALTATSQKNLRSIKYSHLVGRATQTIACAAVKMEISVPGGLILIHAHCLPLSESMLE